jgi:hypothetical protein
MNDKRTLKKHRHMTAVTCGLIAVALCIAPLVGSALAASPQSASGALPSDLFVTKAPPNAIDVVEARKQAQEGKPVVIRGRVGGSAQPFAKGVAMFLITDRGLKLCKDGCADFCNIPKGTVMNSMAAIQVVDGSGRPMRASIDGKNGLKPLADVVITGKVAQVNKKILIVNAEKIFVEPGKK